MEIVQRWRKAAVQLDIILFAPPNPSIPNEPRQYLDMIVAAAAALEKDAPEIAAKARHDVERFTGLVERWYQMWWPPAK